MVRPTQLEIQPGMQRHTVYFAGNVQGIGFRVTALKIAQRYNVTGDVMNLPSGQVMLVAEGLTAQIGYMLIDLMTELSGHIKEIEMTIEPMIFHKCSHFEIIGLSKEEQACLDSQ